MAALVRLVPSEWGSGRGWPALELLKCLLDGCVAGDQLQGLADAPGVAEQADDHSGHVVAAYLASGQDRRRRPLPHHRLDFA
jgi:hypothetical protein